MNWQSLTFDWNQARAFLATAETGSLSAAARALRQTQPTLGRQVAALEAALGVTLFQRAGRSLALTQSGLDLLEHFRSMGDAASRISLAASGQSQAIEGLVTITASDSASAFWLPRAIARIRKAAPGIEIELIASNDIRDLRRREADIAIRHVRPDQPELIARLVRAFTAHLCAAPDYLDLVGRPQTPAGLNAFDFVGFAPIDRLVQTLNSLGLTLERTNFKTVTDNGVAMGELVRQGLGIGVMPAEYATALGLERVLPQLAPLTVPLWLVTHRELLTSRRIRLVFDSLAETLSEPVTSLYVPPNAAGRK